MTWIKTVPLAEASESLRRALEAQRQLYPAEYATPVQPTDDGVAGWETKLVEKLPKALKGSLPTVEEIKAELSGELRRRPKTPRRKP